MPGGPTANSRGRGVALLALDLAVPDRDQRLPARAGEQRPAAVAVRPWSPGRVPRSSAGRGAGGGSVAAAHSRRVGERRVRRSSRDRRVAAEHAAGPDRRIAVPARPAARRADPARRARLAGRGGADLLGTTTIAVNGMLQRARARVEQAAPTRTRFTSLPNRPTVTCSTGTSRRSRTPASQRSCNCCARTPCSRCRRR